MTNDQFENHSVILDSQLTKPSGYAMRGPWDHADAAAAVREGDIAVTEYKGIGGRAAFVALVVAARRGVCS